jgi:transcriptional regulator with XRE-family HTH domain
MKITRPGYAMTDKRETAALFRSRLRGLIARRNETLSAFSRRTDIERPALSQFLDEKSCRLPRAETLAQIAASESVSVDWLLGLSQSERTVGEVANATNIETAAGGVGQTRLAEWHREATGYKIRYVPATLPDLLRTDAVLEYEFRAGQPSLADARAGQSRHQLAYSRRPETDMEIAMPRHRLADFAAGAGIWSGLPAGARKAQLAHMADLLAELYPTVRLFLYDGLKTFSAPFTVFGPKRAAIYLGDMYLVVNSVGHIRELSARFDHLVRVAEIAADRAAVFVSQLKVR